MRFLLGQMAAAALISAPAFAVAQTDPIVVVELFTSQGCASCPPADELLRELKNVRGVVPLAFHVDYWDYIGWKDVFAQAEFTARQEYYAKRRGENVVYTPQAIVNGTYAILGGDGVAIGESVVAAMQDLQDFKLKAQRVDGVLHVTADAIPHVPADVLLVHYTPEETVEIMGGENAGRNMTYINIVTKMDELGKWFDADPLALSYPSEDNGPAYVLLQEEGPGRILAVAEVKSH